MAFTDDTQMSDIKAKLESLLQQMDDAKSEGVKTIEAYQIVTNILKDCETTEEAKDVVKVFVDAHQEQIKKTTDQLLSIDRRIEAGKYVLEALNDADKLLLMTALMLFIGAERPKTEAEEKPEA